MKNVAKRGFFALLLSGVLALGVVCFLGVYLVKGQDWVVFSGSPHVYSAGNLNTGWMVDSQGQILMDSTDGRAYAQDADLRTATLHLLGDREGYIDAPILKYYADEMVGYNAITGIYHLSDSPRTATMTVDGNLQVTALEALGGLSGTVAVYNYETGEILCAVTSPTYDPDNVPDIQGDTTGQYSGVYVNRFMNSTYTPGSVFKIVTLAAAIEEIEDLEQRHFTCTGSYTVGGDTVTCNGVHGTIDVETGFAKSCNVVFGQLAQELGGEVLDDYAEKMGLLDVYTTDGYTTKPGTMSATDAYDVNVAWAGIGQYTNQVNPYGFLQMLGAIAQEGVARQGYYLADIDGKSVVDKQNVTLNISPATCRTLAEMMAYNVETVYGTSRFPIDICAKSGTAEVGTGITPHAVFAGFSQDAQYPVAFFALVENGGSGSQVAGDVISKVLGELTK